MVTKSSLTSSAYSEIPRAFKLILSWESNKEQSH